MRLTMRASTITRKTKETDISVTIAIDGTGRFIGTTGIALFDHFLEQIATHGMIDIAIDVTGDLDVGGHHTVEDLGYCLGGAISSALGERSGICRFGNARVPMEHSLVEVDIDLVDRPLCDMGNFMDWSNPMSMALGDLDLNMFTCHFFRTMAMHGRFTLHVDMVRHGSNNHHLAEATYKAFGLALRRAAEIDPRRAGIPSSKGEM